MKRNRFIGADGIAHTRPLDSKPIKKKNVDKGGRPKGTFNDSKTSQEEIDICLNCPEPTCRPSYCKRIKNVCKNCKHLVFSDCYAECGKGHKEGIVHPFDSCEYFEKWRK